MRALLDVRDLTIRFPQARGGRAVSGEAGAAVRGVSFSIAPGEVLGLMGESGSGKSITSLAIMGLLPASARVTGQIYFQDSGQQANEISVSLKRYSNTNPSPAESSCGGTGEDARRSTDLTQTGSVDLAAMSSNQLRLLRGSRIAMIFQEPMTALNPVMRVGEQIAEAVLAHHRVSKAEAWRRAVEGMREVAIPDPEQRARSYPHQLSGGMRQRVMIAMAIVNRPQLLIADEPTTALDVTIQQQILDLLNELRRKFGLAMLFISHDLAVVSHVADRVAVMYAGSLVELSAKRDIFNAPAHPYTRGLLRAIPTLTTDREVPLATIEGTVPSAAQLIAGCPFEPRCEHRVTQCAVEFPPLVEVGAGHWARCPVVNPPRS